MLCEFCLSEVIFIALGCQKKIAIAIRHAEADYLLALKDNRAVLQEELRSVVHLRSVRHLADGTSSGQDRYYLKSLPPDSPLLLQLARTHWSIENQCHWVMDVVYGEDASRARKGHAAQNLSLLWRLSHNLLKNDKTVRDYIGGKRKRACLSTDTFETFHRLSNSK